MYIFLKSWGACEAIHVLFLRLLLALAHEWVSVGYEYG